MNWELPVDTAWDIGVSDMMALWCFQTYADHIDVVDYTEGSGKGFDWYAEQLDARGYHGVDFVPHKGARGRRARRQDPHRDAVYARAQAAPRARSKVDGRDQRRAENDTACAFRSRALQARP